MSGYPQLRMRRLRRHDWTRRLVAENTLSVSDLIWPLFIIEGENKRGYILLVLKVWNDKNRLLLDSNTETLKDANAWVDRDENGDEEYPLPEGVDEPYVPEPAMQEAA